MNPMPLLSTPQAIAPARAIRSIATTRYAAPVRGRGWLRSMVRPLLLALSLAGGLAPAAVQAAAAATAAPISGEIQHLSLTTPGDYWSGGTIVVGNQSIIIPRNLLVDLPANRLTLWQLVDQAPAACKALGQTGLAKSDTCNTSGKGGFAFVAANRTRNGNVIAGDLFLEKGRESVSGVVTYINHTDGYLRINGTEGGCGGARPGRSLGEGPALVVPQARPCVARPPRGEGSRA